MRGVRGTGVRVDASRKAHGTIPAFDGRHEWIIAAVFKCAEPARDRHELDTENLLTIEGPRCWWCEQRWRPDLSARCPGELIADSARG